MGEPLKTNWIKCQNCGHKVNIKSIIKPVVEFVKKYLDNPISYFGRFPKQLKPFWKYVGVNPDIMIEGELINWTAHFNEWLIDKAFPDIIQKKG